MSGGTDVKVQRAAPQRRPSAREETPDAAQPGKRSGRVSEGALVSWKLQKKISEVDKCVAAMSVHICLICS